MARNQYRTEVGSRATLKVFEGADHPRLCRSDNLWPTWVPDGWWIGELRSKHNRPISSVWSLCRSDPQRCKAGRIAILAADQIGACA